jgi:hypothetical protein
MKISELMNPGVRTALTKIFQDDTLPRVVALKVKRLVIAVDAELGKFDSMRATLIEEFALKNDKGDVIKDERGNVDFTPENKLEFFKKEAELKDMDVMVQPLKMAELGDTRLSAQDLFHLDKMVKE